MPELPSTARGAATSRRILDAAAREFAERGIAGARIDRITEAARTNKAQVYGYFGSKDGLFDAVVTDSVDRITEAVPFLGGAADEMAAWAVRLYDSYLERPELVRLTTWIRLERRPTGPLFDGLGRDPKMAVIAAAQEAGSLRAGDPADIVALVVAMSCAWSPASSIHTATPDEPSDAHERRRTLLYDAVRGALTP